MQLYLWTILLSGLKLLPLLTRLPSPLPNLLVEHTIVRHGVPLQLLSDHGLAFMSHLLKEVYELMGMRKLNTTAYHPQTDGLVEQFNWTLTDMLVKTVEASGWDWDSCLPYILFTYRTSP